MNPNWLGVTCAVGALIAFDLSYRLGKRLNVRKRRLAALIAILLAIPGLSFAAYYAHLVAEPAWYFELRSWRGTEAFLILIGVAGGLAASLAPFLGTIVPRVMVAVFAMVPMMKPFIGPIPQGIMKDQWQKDVCLQSTYSTCGPASTASILRHHGLTASEGEIARQAYSYLGGTEVWYLARVARRHGCKTSIQVEPGYSPEVPLPAVAGVRLGATGHFIAILSREGDRFRIGDPLRGSEIIPREELARRYQFTGFYMSILRP